MEVKRSDSAATAGTDHGWFPKRHKQTRQKPRHHKGGTLFMKLRKLFSIALVLALALTSAIFTAGAES